MSKTEEEKKDRKVKRERAKARRRKARKDKSKRYKCGLVVTFLANKTSPGTPGDQFPGRYYGARKRRRSAAGTDKTRHVALRTA